MRLQQTPLSSAWAQVLGQNQDQNPREAARSQPHPAKVRLHAMLLQVKMAGKRLFCCRDMLDLVAAHDDDVLAAG